MVDRGMFNSAEVNGTKLGETYVLDRPGWYFEKLNINTILYTHDLCCAVFGASFLFCIESEQLFEDEV